MKLLVLAVLVATFAFAVDSATKGLGQRIECMDGARYESRIYEQKIKDALMKLAQKLATEGLPEQGIPPIDPFVLNNLHIALNQSLAQLNMNLTDGQVVGLTKFEIPTLTLSLVGLKFTYGFNWPSIHGQGKYELDGVLGGVMPVFGHGDFDIEANNLLIEGTGKLGSDENKFLFLENFTISISLETFKVVISGLMDDPKISQIISEMASESLPALLDEFHDNISGFLAPKIIDMADKFLANKTLSDIMGGLGREYIPCNNQILLEN